MNVRHTIKSNNRLIRYGGVILFAVLLSWVCVFFYIHKEYNKNISYLGGDEPHYIMMTDSLVKDGEFNLRNDYYEKRSKEYYPVPLYPHVSPVFSKNSPEWYSIHTTGLPIILSVPYKLFGLQGARVWIMFLQLASAVMLYFLIKRYTKSTARAAIGLGILLLCPLFWQNFGSFFPDLLIVSMWGAALLLFGRKDVASNLALMSLLLLATLTHSKGMILIGPLVLMHVLWLIKQQGVAVWFKQQRLANSLIVLSALLYVYYLRTRYGVWTPTGVYGGNGQLFSANPLINTVALATDRSKGLLVHFPLIVALLPYIFMGAVGAANFIKNVYQKSVKPTVDSYFIAGVISGVLLYMITVLGFNDWSGATGPNGRSMIPMIFLAIFLAAKYINLKNWVEIAIGSILVCLSAWLTWLSINDFVYYMSVGVNSFWVDRFSPLERLPIFPLVADHASRAELYRGVKITALLLLFGAFLFVLYKYKIIFKKWNK